MTKGKFEQAAALLNEIDSIETYLNEISGKEEHPLFLNKDAFYIIHLVGEGMVSEMLIKRKKKLEEKFKRL